MRGRGGAIKTGLWPNFVRVRRAAWVVRDQRAAVGAVISGEYNRARRVLRPVFERSVRDRIDQSTPDRIFLFFRKEREGEILDKPRQALTTAAPPPISVDVPRCWGRSGGENGCIRRSRAARSGQTRRAGRTGSCSTRSAELPRPIRWRRSHVSRSGRSGDYCSDRSTGALRGADGHQARYRDPKSIVQAFPQQDDRGGGEELSGPGGVLAAGRRSTQERNELSENGRACIRSTRAPHPASRRICCWVCWVFGSGRVRDQRDARGSPIMSGRFIVGRF